MKQAVCVLIEHPVTEQVLCVSRRDNLDDWALPGGKVDPGESLYDAACRELYEETGLDIGQFDALNSCHERTCRGQDNYNCTVFKLVNPSDRVLEFEFKDSPEGKVEWREWSDLISDKASFKDYNLELMYKLIRDEHVENG